MIATTQKSESHYTQFVGLLRELHRLIRCGEGDSEESDIVRDKMDIHWPHLSSTEIQRTEELSASLYSLSGTEHIAPEDKDRPVSECELQVAWESKDYDHVLALLRRPMPFMDADEIAFRRGWIWYELRDLQSAVLFFRLSYDLNPNIEQTAIFLIHTLLQIGSQDEARQIAERIIDQTPPASPTALDAAAFAIFVAIQTADGGEQRRMLLRVIDAVKKSTEQAQASGTAEAAVEMDLHSHYMVLSHCFALLAQLQARNAKESGGGATTLVDEPETDPGIGEPSDEFSLGLEITHPNLARHGPRRFRTHPFRREQAFPTNFKTATSSHR